MLSEVKKICVDVACFSFARRLRPSQPRPAQEQHFTTEDKHLEDVQNMSALFGDARLLSGNTDDCSPSKSHLTMM
ncbi:hypothetical protein PAMP_002927 [Pampus punctatissimus]